MKDLLDMQMFSRNMSRNDACLDDLPLAYAYVPYQGFETPYDKEQALKCGTVFPGLNKPFGVYGKEFKKKGRENRL